MHRESYPAWGGWALQAAFLALQSVRPQLGFEGLKRVRVGPEKVSLVGELLAQGEEARDPGLETVSWGEKKR